MKAKFIGSAEVYTLQVTVPGPGLVQLHPPFPEVKLTTGFRLLTDKGSVYGDYQDYTTIYRQMEDGSVILSNDGRVWSPPPPPEPGPEPVPPTLEMLKEIKKLGISADCERVIYAGVSVELPSGWERFSLTEKDQINLFGKQAQLAAGAEHLEYHQDGHPCRYYSAAEMQMIIKTAMEHVSYHTTYCNALNMWIAGAETAEELEGIFYGADIPEKYQSEVLKDYLARMMATAGGEVKEKGAEVV